MFGLSGSGGWLNYRKGNNLRVAKGSLGGKIRGWNIEYGKWTGEARAKEARRKTYDVDDGTRWYADLL